MQENLEAQKSYIALVSIHVLYETVLVNLGVRFGQFHIVKDSEEHLEQIFPPVWLERRAVGFDDVEKNG